MDKWDGKQRHYVRIDGWPAGPLGHRLQWEFWCAMDYMAMIGGGYVG